MDVLNTIGDALSTIGNFIASIPKVIYYIIDFIYSCINECLALLGVIPTIIGSLMVAALLFSVIVAVKRLVID